MKYTPYKALFGNISITPRRRKKYFKSYMIKPSFYKKSKIPKKQWKNINEISNPKFKRYIKRTRNYKAMYQDWDKDGVINKYDCEPTNKWKQGKVRLEDEENFKRAANELINVQNQIYALRNQQMNTMDPQEKSRLGRKLLTLNDMENELKTTTLKYKQILGVTNRLGIGKSSKEKTKESVKLAEIWKGIQNDKTISDIEKAKLWQKIQRENINKKNASTRKWEKIFNEQERKKSKNREKWEETFQKQTQNKKENTKEWEKIFNEQNYEKGKNRKEWNQTFNEQNKAKQQYGENWQKELAKERKHKEEMAKLRVIENEQMRRHQEEMFEKRLNPELYTREGVFIKRLTDDLRQRQNPIEGQLRLEDKRNPFKKAFDKIQNPFKKRTLQERYSKIYNETKEDYMKKGLSELEAHNIALFKTTKKLKKEWEEDTETKSTLKPRDWSNVKLKGGRIRLL